MSWFPEIEEGPRSFPFLPTVVFFGILLHLFGLPPFSTIDSPQSLTTARFFRVPFLFSHFSLKDLTHTHIFIPNQLVFCMIGNRSGRFFPPLLKWRES